MAKFLRDKTYFCCFLKEEIPSFGGNTFTVVYKQGNKIHLANAYDKEKVLKCSLEQTPNEDIIELPNGHHIWREFAQEKYADGTFEKLVIRPVDEEFEF